eukprot:TRINITY_DN4313_c0_g2_i1.p1 TRINITY_DN4313_c0_g2~~TRINITY_DN4313_c0_g2_i1.p1  ORF type:complete len:215 (-),score=20.97 TRINITY_DN4313_c0_g2_i1:339-983(-)
MTVTTTPHSQGPGTAGQDEGGERASALSNMPSAAYLEHCSSASRAGVVMRISPAPHSRVCHEGAAEGKYGGGLEDGSTCNSHSTASTDTDDRRSRTVPSRYMRDCGFVDLGEQCGGSSASFSSFSACRSPASSLQSPRFRQSEPTTLFRTGQARSDNDVGKLVEFMLRRAADRKSCASCPGTLKKTKKEKEDAKKGIQKEARDEKVVRPTILSL